MSLSENPGSKHTRKSLFIGDTDGATCSVIVNSLLSPKVSPEASRSLLPVLVWVAVPEITPTRPMITVLKSIFPCSRSKFASASA
jgi:hypothetical protein